MGDRANVVMRFPWQEEGGEPEIKRLYLYTHSRGHDLPEALRRGLTIHGNSRWDDAPYLCRIIFREMIRGSEEQETGSGLSPYICDNSYPILAVDCGAQRVFLEDEAGGDLGPSWTFAEFIQLSQSDCEKCRELPEGTKWRWADVKPD